MVLNFRIYTYLIFVLMLLCSGGSLFSQTDFKGGVLPKVKLSKKLEKDYSLNLSAENRSYIFHKSGAEFYSEFEYKLTDIALILSKRTGLSDKLAFGYLSRFEGKKVEHRIIEQFSTVKQYRIFMLGHRFASVQTFSQHFPNELRLRYRISAELPLNGGSENQGETYLKISNEYLNSFTKKELFDPEIRLSAFYGFIISGQELEIGIENRISSFTDGALCDKIWLRFNWHISF